MAIHISMRRKCVIENRHTTQMLTVDQFGDYLSFSEYLDGVNSLRRFLISVVQYEQSGKIRTEESVKKEVGVFFNCIKGLFAFFVDDTYPRIHAKPTDYNVVRDMAGRFVKRRNAEERYFQHVSAPSFRKSIEDFIADRIIYSESAPKKSKHKTKE